MRSGRLLAEESPQSLLTMYRCSNLEDVFLKLSRKQGASNNELAELNIRFVFYMPAHFFNIREFMYAFSISVIICH